MNISTSIPSNKSTTNPASSSVHIDDNELNYSSEDSLDGEVEEYIINNKAFKFLSYGEASKKPPVVLISNKICQLKVKAGTEGIQSTLPRRKYVCRCRNCKAINGCFFTGEKVKGKVAPAFGCFFCDEKQPFHAACFFKIIELKFGGNYLKSRDGDLIFICGNKCYSKMKKKKDITLINIGMSKSVEKEVAMPHWDSDDPDPKKCSISILLEWLTTEENANLYLGAEDTIGADNGFGGNEGQTKDASCVSISNLIETKNGLFRSAKSVRCKLDSLFAKYRATKDFTMNTGVGLEATTSAETYQNMIRDKFEYFYILDPVLSVRPNFAIPFDTDDVDEGLKVKDANEEFGVDATKVGPTISEDVNEKDPVSNAIVPFVSDSTKDSKRPASNAIESLKEMKKNRWTPGKNLYF